MNKFKKLSLQIIIPTVLFVVFIVLQGGVFFLQYQQTQQNLYTEKEQYVKGIAGNLQTMLSNSLMRLEKARAQQIVSVTALDENFKSIAIVDHNQQIVLSNNLREKYMFAKLQLPFYDGKLLQQVIEQSEFVFQYNDKTQDLIVYAPLQMLAKGNSLNRKFNGVIFINYSLKNALQALRHNALISLVKISVTLLIAIFLLIYVINRIVIKPLNQLARATKTADLSSRIEIDELGIGEIGLLQESFSLLTTEVKQNINKLSASEQRWLYALSGAQDGVWDWDINSDNVYYSSRWKEMLGYHKEDIGKDIDEWESRIHPDDLFNVLQDLQFHFIGRNSFFENTHRIRCLNGEYRWILSRGQTVSWDSDSLPLRVIGTNTDVTMYKESQELIKQQAQFDDITQLPNKAHLLKQISQESKRALHNKQHGAVIFIECDQYKTINDLQGHFKGDELLYQIARRIEENCTEADFVAHLNGSEFVILSPDLHQQRENAALMTLELCKTLDKQLKLPIEIGTEKIDLCCAFGIELFPSEECDSHDLLRQSAMAMKYAKENQFTNISFFAKEIEETIINHYTLQKQIRSGLENNEFTLYFQPRTDVHGDIIGAEALSRWLHGEQGWVSPSEFIPIAEESDLILKLGDWVLRSSFESLALWQNKGLPASFKHLSLNISPKQLLQTSFIHNVESQLQHSGASASLIEIEITETILVEHKELVIGKLHKLRELGFNIAIDDFGTGYSSFSYLSKLPVSTIKIDQSFIKNLMEDDKQQIIVASIISMAKALKLEVVAEGVETQAQLDFLIEKGCSQFQGYFVAKPLTIKAFQTVLFKI